MFKMNTFPVLKQNPQKILIPQNLCEIAENLYCGSSFSGATLTGRLMSCYQFFSF